MWSMQKIAGAVIVLLLAAVGLPAQSLSADSLYDPLIDHRVLRGTIARRQTTHDVTFEWMLGRAYVQMHEVSRERVSNGTPAYEAVVLFGRDPRSGNTPACGSTTRAPARSIRRGSAAAR
jgi:hypothetical protein